MTKTERQRATPWRRRHWGHGWHTKAYSYGGMVTGTDPSSIPVLVTQVQAQASKRRAPQASLRSSCRLRCRYSIAIHPWRASLARGPGPASLWQSLSFCLPSGPAAAHRIASAGHTVQCCSALATLLPIHGRVVLNLLARPTDVPDDWHTACLNLGDPPNLRTWPCPPLSRCGRCPACPRLSPSKKYLASVVVVNPSRASLVKE
ncbi:hypothetical protein IWZ01DRAFT_239788 [Phyllosticta capitalensis]